MRSRGGVVGLVLLLILGAVCLRRGGQESAVVARPSPPSPPTPVASTAPIVEAPAAVQAAPVASSTSIVVLRWRTDRIELVGQIVKPSRLVAEAEPGPAAVRWRLADAATGRVLAEGPVAAPRLCDCDASADHARGCRRLRHEAVVRLKLPHLAPRERLVIHDGDRELAALDLEGTS